MGRPSCFRVSRAAAALPLLALVLLALAGCDSPAETLGLQRTTPDEFSVAVGPNLVVPPDYGLRAPGTGEPPPLASEAESSALPQLMDVGAGTAISPGEQAFLEAAGAARVDPSIRQRVTEATQGTAVENDLFVEDLLFWQGSSDAAPEEPVIDPEAEARGLDPTAAPTDEGARESSRCVLIQC